MAHTGHRRRFSNLSLVPVVLLFGFFFTACSSGANESNTAMSAQSLVSLALRNAIRAGWVHEELQESGGGHSLSMVNDIGSTEGRQVVAVDGAHATVLVLDGVAYIQGDANALANYFGLSSKAQQLVGKWISLRSSDSKYSTVSDAVTLTSNFQQVVMNGPFTEGHVVVVDGRSAVPIGGYAPVSSGNTAEPATLYVTTAGTVLPVAYHVSAQQGTQHATLAAIWRDWGRPVTLVAPANAIPISTLGG